MASPNVTKVTDANFEQEVLKSTKPVVVDFYADWCGPCKNMAPHLDAYADENTAKVKVVKVSVDDSPKAAAQYKIRSIPTLIVFSGGKPVDGSAGGRNKQGIEKFVDAALQKLPPANVNKAPAVKPPQP